MQSPKWLAKVILGLSVYLIFPNNIIKIEEKNDKILDKESLAGAASLAALSCIQNLIPQTTA